MAFITFILIAANVLFSIRGFRNQSLLYKYEFAVEKVKIYKDYKRLFTSGFLHVNWMHLIFNMIALFFFGPNLENAIGPFEFALIYVAGLLGGNILSLLIHKYNSSYSSVGASGAVLSIMFSSIALFPGMQVGLLFIPLPGWLFGLAYVLVSIYGIRSKNENIGHDSHLGGALTGMVVAILLHPSALANNLVTILIIAVPAIAFIIFIMKNPAALLVDNLYFRKKHHFTIEDSYNLKRRDKQEEIDRVLEKIHRNGMKSLNEREKRLLEEYSKQL